MQKVKKNGAHIIFVLPHHLFCCLSAPCIVGHLFFDYNQLEEFHIRILEGQSQQEIKVNNEIMNAARRLDPHLERLDMWFFKDI